MQKENKVYDIKPDFEFIFSRLTTYSFPSSQSWQNNFFSELPR